MDVFFERERDSLFSIEIGYFDTVLEIKQKIQKYQRIPVSKQSLFFHGNLLKDEQDIEQCGILNTSRLQLVIEDHNQINKTEQSDLPENRVTNPKKLRITVVQQWNKRKILMEVNAKDNVGKLRKELAKIQQRFQFSLPEEGYFFVYKQELMDDDRSFRWHGVHTGDIIEIFSGRISNGS